jgi:ubiquinone/menaquinone biosynthesis C-methylase UbiE
MPTPTPPVCDYEGSDYQATFWDRGERAYEDQVEALALKRLLPASGKLLLEVGAGAGRNTPRYTGFERIVLLDYSRTQLEQAQKRLGAGAGYLFVAADAYRLPFAPGLFDTATMIRTLHHMAEPWRVLEGIRQALAPGGVFILEFANKQNLKAIVRYLLHRQDWNPFSPEAVEFTELNFDFHPAAVRGWLRESGFQVERQLTVSHFRLDFLKRLAPLRLLVAMDSLAQLTGNWWQLSPSVFVRAQAVGQALAGSALAADGRQVESAADPITYFCCPACGQTPLEETLPGLSCPRCGREWPVREGIYDFRGRV